jgi:hypothetical protein
MTEQEWLACDDSQKLLEFAHGTIQTRKLKLFALACCRSVWHLLNDSRSRNAAEVAEQFVDGGSSLEVLIASIHQADLAFGEAELESQVANARLAIYFATDLASKPTPTLGAVQDSAAAALQALTASESAGRDEMKLQASLLRHIFGNPFKPYPAPPSWRSSVIQLAESLYNGQDCSFALHDALLEAGHAELAEHFSKEQWHPKGCWVVDQILGKE